MGRDMGNALRIGLVVLAGALAMTGCGVNGPLEPPGGMTTETKPAPQAGAKPYDPFILDGILR